MTAHEHTRSVAHFFPKHAVMGFRIEGRPGIDKGLVFLVDLSCSPIVVYGIGRDETSAVADCQARNGEAYASCCKRNYGMHDRKCHGYTLNKF